MTPLSNDAAGPDRAADLSSRLFWLSSAAPVLKANYLIKNWLGQGTLSVVFGPSNVGKTFVVLDMALHVAADMPWRGCRVKGGPVLYIAAEGGSGILNRLAAFKQEHPKMADAPLMVLPTTLDLYGDGDALALCNLIEDACDELGQEPVLIVVDTLARCMGDGDENQTKDMGRFVRNCDVLRVATGAHVLVVHHTGKDGGRGARGSSALKGACDTEIEIKSDKRIICDKQRDMPKGAPLQFDLRIVNLGFDQDGDPVTSCVVEIADPPAPSRKALTPPQEAAMNALDDAIREHGTLKSDNHYPTGTMVVPVEAWREACRLSGLAPKADDDPKKKADAERKAFTRAKRDLINVDQVGEHDGFVWKVHDE